MKKRWMGALLAAVCLLSACTPAVGSPNTDTESDSTWDTEESDSVLNQDETTEGAEDTTCAETESETEGEQIEYTDWIPGSVCLSQNNAHNVFQVTADNSIGGGFTVAEGCFVTSLTVRGPSWGNKTGSMDFYLYKWDTDYLTSRQGEPVFSGKAADFIDLQTYTFRFEDGLVGGGTYVYTFCNGSEDMVGVFTASLDSRGSADGVITNVKGFNETRENGNSPYVHLTYQKPATTTDPEAGKLGDTVLTTPTKGKAHVIVLLGQSNASGHTNSALLHEALGHTLEYRGYEKGYDNVLINYNCTDRNSSNGFVPVKLGQGFLTDRFGPEVGLAAELAEAYPDETFYIIKQTRCWDHNMQRIGLYNEWGDKGELYAKIWRDIKEILAGMKNDGLDPEIMAVCWLQGEEDGYDFGNARLYGERELAFFDSFETRFSDVAAPGGMTFISAAISESSYWTYSTVVNEQKEWNANHRANLLYIDEGATMYCMGETDDYWHFDSTEMIRMGRLFGKSVLQVLENRT